MAEHKFTDEELQKCIECCIKAETWGDCETMACPASTRHGCRFYLRTDDDYENTIYIEILKDVLDLINRQKAEIAEEIFAEIEEAINNLEYTAKSPTKTVILEKMTEVVNWVLHEVVPNRIAELKKKYMIRETSNEEKCLVCGTAIPEGRQVCPNCAKGGDN